MRRWVVSALLLLQAAAPALTNEEPNQKVLKTDPESDTKVVQRVGTQEDGWDAFQNGWELVDGARAEFRKIKPSQGGRKTKRPSGLFATTMHYLSKALPSLRPSSSPHEHDHGHDHGHGHGSIGGPLLEGVKMLHQAADRNNSDAIYLLAQMNFFGNYSHPRNLKVAFDHYERLALLNGNSSAQHMVGLMYSTGLGDVVERDQAKALLYYTFAANQGHTRAQMTMAARYHGGIGIFKSCDMAVNYYKAVADKAIVWYRSGPPGGMALIPEAHRIADETGGVYGEGASAVSSGLHAPRVNPNSDAYSAIDDVIEYLDLMSQKGDYKASYNLGLIYYEGQRDLPRDVDMAKRYFLTVASKYWRQKDGRANDNVKPGLEKFAAKSAGYMGRIWMRGEGQSTKQNLDNAKKWFERGIKHGDAQSQWGLGWMLLKGYPRSLPKNIPRAIELLKAAADQDYSPAQVALGALYLDQGNPDDIRVANHYFDSAARYGHMEAQYYLAEMIHHGVGRDRTCNAALWYYKQVSERAEPLLSSWHEANQAYADGDYELALLSYIIAAEQGYEKAQNNVAFMLDPLKSRLALPSFLQPPQHHTHNHAKSPRQTSLLRNSALALIYWTRSAIQSNIDSLVKMGDYYLSGIGTELAVDKAVQCYTGASEYFQSAQALYNLAWMHENGVGLKQDYHLAKRYYDHTLETSEEAYLPVILSLLQLRARSAWNTLTRGEVNSIRDEPRVKKEWGVGEWLANFFMEEWYFDDVEAGADQLYDEANGDAGMVVGSDGQMGAGAGGEEAGFLPAADEDDGVVDGLVVLVLFALIVFLIYYRQQRMREARGEGREGERQPQGQPQGQGLGPAQGWQGDGLAFDVGDLVGR